jgi:hypothetical protein
MTPAQVARRVAEIIRSRPDEHDQSSWFNSDDRVVVPVAEILTGGCGTTCCVAGWAAAVAAPEGSRFTDDDGDCVIYPDGSRESIENAGIRALGFDLLWPFVPGLFLPTRTRDEVLAELDRIAGGGDPGAR